MGSTAGSAGTRPTPRPGATAGQAAERAPRDFTALGRVRTAEPRLPEGCATGTALKVLLESLRLFAHHGYHGTSTRQIAAAVGVRAPSLYEHFGSKQHILQRLVLIGHGQMLQALTSAIEDCPADADASTAVRALVRAHVLSHVTYPLLAIVTNDEMHHLEPGHLTEALDLRSRTELLAVRTATRGVRDGEFDGERLGTTLAAISSMGVRAPYWFVPTAEQRPEDLAEVYADLAVRMLRTDTKQV